MAPNKSPDLELAEKSSSPKKGGFFRRNASSIEVEETKPKAQPPPISFSKLFRFAQPFEIALNLLGLLASVVAGASLPLMTLVVGRLTQDFIIFGRTAALSDAGDPDAIVQLPIIAEEFRHNAALNASYLAFIAIGTFVCTFIYMSFWVYTAEICAKRLRERYLESILRQDMAFFDKVGAGEVATRIQTDCHLVQQAISEKVPLTVSFVSQFISGFVVAYVRSWRLALALTTIFPILAISGKLLNKYITKYKQYSLQSVAEGGTVAEEGISTVRTAHAFGIQTTLSFIYDHHIGQSLSWDDRSATWQGFALGVVFFCASCIYALACSFGTTLINQGNATAGAVVTVILAILFSSMSLGMVFPELQAINQGRAAATKLFSTIDLVPDIDSSNPDGLKPATVQGDIVLEDIRFTYASRPDVPVLNGIDLHFPPGKSIALVGASGCGKSTIISLIERFYDPLSGHVKLDGQDIRDLNLTWLRSQIGLVSQEPVLFSTTILGNVEYGLIGSSHEHSPDAKKFQLVRDACIMANADNFISSLPNGYSTLVGERGFLLSGGQKQRIAIARAIVSDPKILLLDEATSALDTQSEGIVQQALDNASKGRTTITIAHRLSTIKDVDIIYVLSEGNVIESGTHDQLLHNQTSSYARLIESQKIRQGKEVEGEEVEKDITLDELALDRQNTSHSLHSDIALIKPDEQGEGKKEVYSLPSIFWRMARINRDQASKYFAGFIFACLTGAIQPAIGLVFALGIQGFSDPDPHQRRFLGDRNALWCFVIAILACITMFCKGYLFTSAAAHLAYNLRSLSFKAILKQDVEYFDRNENESGILTSKLSENAQKVYGLAGVTMGTIIQAVSTVITGMIIGLVLVWKVALVSLGCTPLIIGAGFVRLHVVVLAEQKNKRAHEKSAQLACEAAGAIRTVASLTREKHCLQLYGQALEEPLRQSKQTTFWSNILYSLSQGMLLCTISLVFWFGSRLVSTREYNTFEFFVSIMSVTFGAAQVAHVFSLAPDISEATSAGSDIIHLLDSKPKIDADSSEGKKVESVSGEIQFNNVHFRYPTRSAVPVLRGLDLTIKAGSFVALVGASGSGKSTVIQLIERFYDCLQGDIYLDGQNIQELNVSSYRKELALVSQEPTLYAGTIRFNILLGSTKPPTEVTTEELEEACRKSNILDFIQSLPDQFDTEVGGKGSQLSGGQKQRIALARALLRKPKVLLLDEATSALDSTSERVVQEALDEAAKGRTTIAIAHRLSTIQNADLIYFIKDGRVAEAGTHDQLLASNGEYSEFVSLQRLGA